ncbi:MAG: hypothetical protein CMP10_16975 [Zetaproteobacteria bacterium]|nr:hypothetical protein [Pseudobdellovibrionaceae bacterium]
MFLLGCGCLFVFISHMVLVIVILSRYGFNSQQNIGESMIRFSLLLCLLWSGCTETVETSSNASGNEDGLDEGLVDEPVSVSGAFLHCAISETEVENQKTMGCRLEDQDRSKRSDVNVYKEDIIAIARGNTLGVYIAENLDVNWHWLIGIGEIPLAELQLQISPRFVDLDKSRLPAGLKAEVEVKPQHLLFYTTLDYSVSDLIDMEIADGHCATEADFVGFPAGLTWRALLTDTQSSSDHRVVILGPVINSKNELLTIATGNNFWNSTFGKKVLPGNPSESPTPMTDVWTGINPDSQAPPDDCENWVSSDPNVNGAVGNIDSTDKWLYEKILPCDQTARLYCLSNGDLN